MTTCEDTRSQGDHQKGDHKGRPYNDMVLVSSSFC